MKLCYQVATPDVAVSPSVTAYQGDLERSLAVVSELGYDGVEFMTVSPAELNLEDIKALLEKYELCAGLICTGEVFGQLGVSFTDPDESVRKKAVDRVIEIVDFAAELGANINIGRVRGQYLDGVPREFTYGRAVDALRTVCDHAAPKGVNVALETVTIMQTNFLNTVSEAVQMIKDVERENCKVMMDLFRLNLEEKDIFETIRKYISYTVHVHLADNNRQFPGQCGFDFRKIASAFKEAGYDGLFSTEIYQIPDQNTAIRGTIKTLAPIFRDIYGRPEKGG